MSKSWPNRTGIMLRVLMLQVAVSMLTYQTTNGKKQTLAKCKKAFSLYTFQVF